MHRLHLPFVAGHCYHADDGWRRRFIVLHNLEQTKKDKLTRDRARKHIEEHLSTIARTFFRKWHLWATRAQLRPNAEVARKLKRHLGNILA